MLRSSIVALFTLCLALAARAQTTTFTYQGRLSDGANPASGSYDLRFGLHDAESGGAQQGNTLTNAATAVTNGLFTVTLDFGNQFPGAARWLEIGVRTNGGGAFSALNPRQLITAAPYAMRAANAMTVTSGTISNPSFLGTTTTAPLQLQVNNQVGLRLEYPTAGSVPNLVGGFNGNSVGAGTEGAVIAGGGSPGAANSISVDSDYSAIGGGSNNNIASNSISATIAGGSFNDIGVDSDYSAIGGGYFNNIGVNSASSAIGGGAFNNIRSNASFATIAGGWNNVIRASSSSSAIGGGFRNNIASDAQFAVIPGGSFNDVGAGADYAFAAGRRAKANHPGAFVWGDSTDADFASTTTNQFSIRASGGVRLNEDTSLFFGAQTRQMLNLWNSGFGIGVQSSTLYQRSNSRFSWYSGGTHSDIENDPGAGGTRLMTIDGNGELHVGGGIFAGVSLQNRQTPNFVSSPTVGERYLWYVSDGTCRLWSGNDKLSVNTAGTVTAVSFNPTSDRNAKENFEPINSREVLEKVAALPITRWNFKQDTSSEHIGPMAQDFHAAFGTGTDDKHIATVDADGVALAAIQGLNQKLELDTQQKDAEIAQLKKLNSELLRRLEVIEARLK